MRLQESVDFPETKIISSSNRSFCSNKLQRKVSAISDSKCVLDLYTCLSKISANIELPY